MTHLARIAALVTNVPLMIQPAKLAVIASILDGRIGIDAAVLPADIAAKAPSAPQSNRYVGQFELKEPPEAGAGISAIEQSFPLTGTNHVRQEVISQTSRGRAT